VKIAPVDMERFGLWLTWYSRDTRAACDFCNCALTGWLTDDVWFADDYEPVHPLPLCPSIQARVDELEGILTRS
jgi:hypothetical protein